MEEFDLIVIGGGSGLHVSSVASEMGLKVAIIEEGPMGGTCLNRGCIPSTIISHSADVAEMIGRSSELGINAQIESIDFAKVIRRASSLVDGEAREIEQAIRSDKNTTLFKTRGRFVGERTLQVGNKTIRGKKIVIAAGTRPNIPKIEGLDTVPFLTSKEALRLKKLPKSMTIIGGGYISAELAHFYGAMWTRITIIQHGNVMYNNEDTLVSKEFTRLFKKKYRVLTGHETVKVAKKGAVIVTTAAPLDGKKKLIIIESEQLLVATGLVPNTDLLDVAKTGVKVNKKGYIVTNSFLETSAKNVWALGDILGKYLFKHSANLDASVIVQNALLGKKMAVDYRAMPHAIFSSPQIAGVGEKEQELEERKADYVVGEYKYINSGMGQALNEREGFVRVYADRKSKKILGCHILGMDASTVIHEAILAMKMGITADQLADMVHIHPALSEVLQRACGAIEW
jgi:dihydrolipoamide dehydrogenase